MECHGQEIFTAYRNTCDDPDASSLRFNEAIMCVVSKKWLYCDFRNAFLESELAKPIRMFEEVFTCVDDQGCYSEDDLCRSFGFTEKDFALFNPGQRAAVMSLRFVKFMVTFHRTALVFSLGAIHWKGRTGTEWTTLSDSAYSSAVELGLDPFWVPTALRITLEIMSCLTSISQQHEGDFFHTRLRMLSVTAPNITFDKPPTELLTDGALDAVTYMHAVKVTNYKNRCLNAIACLRCAFFVEYTSLRRYRLFRTYASRKCLNTFKVVTSDSEVSKYVSLGVVEKSLYCLHNDQSLTAAHLTFSDRDEISKKCSVCEKKPRSAQSPGQNQE